MRTSLNQIKEADNFIEGVLPADDSLVMQARMLVDEDWRHNVAIQQETISLVRAFGRKKLKARLEATHEKLLGTHAESAFKLKISKIFNS